MNNIGEPQDKFGRLVVESIRRSAVVNLYMVVNNKKTLARLTGGALSDVDESTKDAIKNIVLNCIDSAISDFLFALDNPQTYLESLQISVDGVNILDGDIQSKLMCGDGWLELYGNIDEIGNENYLL